MSAPHPVETAPDRHDAALIAAAQTADGIARRRTQAAGAELARPPELVVGDEAKARAMLLIEATIATADAALRAAEPLLDAAPVADIVDRFARAGLLARSGLAATALARAEEHMLVRELGRVLDVDDEGPAARRLDPIGGDLAADAYAVREAEAARLDRTGDPLLPLHDIPPEDRHALFWQVAACLSAAVLAAQGDAAAGSEDATHRAAAAAVARALAGIDDGDGIAAATMRHARSLLEADALDDALLAGTLASGRIASLAAMLGVRAGIGFDEARAMLGAPARAALLLRACAVDRPVAAAMVTALGFALDHGQGGDPAGTAADILDAFDALPIERARAEVRRARLEPVYRDALAALA